MKREAPDRSFVRDSEGAFLCLREDEGGIEGKEAIPQSTFCMNVPLLFYPLSLAESPGTSHFTNNNVAHHLLSITQGCLKGLLSFPKSSCSHELLISSGFSFTTSPTLNPDEYTSMRIALCFKLSTELRISATSSLLRTVGNLLSFRGLLTSYTNFFFSIVP